MLCYINNISILPYCTPRSNLLHSSHIEFDLDCKRLSRWKALFVSNTFLFSSLSLIFMLLFLAVSHSLLLSSVLLIITDGLITDIQRTKQAVVKASSLPISIIIGNCNRLSFFVHFFVHLSEKVVDFVAFFQKKPVVYQ